MLDNSLFKVGIYLRLSREDEKIGESGSITTQRELLLNYIRDNNLLFIDEYVDDGVSGTTFNRSGFNRMINDIKNKRINMVITKDTSRLGRDHIEFGYYVERYFPENNIRYVAVSDGIDTSTNSSNNDMIVFKSAFNDMYVKDISNKIRTSLYTKKKNGQFVGCYAPYGYQKNPDNKNELLIDEEASRIVKKIFFLALNGYSVTKICESLTKEGVKTPSQYKNMHCGQKNVHEGIWSMRTVTDILKNPTYIGNLTQCRHKKVNYKSKKRIHQKSSEWIIKENSCPSIIDKNLFNIIQNMFHLNKNKQGISVTDKLLLRGLVYCKDCKHTIGFRFQRQLTRKYGTVTRIYGNCNYWMKRKKLHVCTPHSIKYSHLENIVLDNIKTLYLDNLNINELEEWFENHNHNNKKIDNVKHEIDIVRRSIEIDLEKIDSTYNDRLENVITLEMYQRISSKLLLEIKNKENNIIELEEHLKKIEKDREKGREFYKKEIRNFVNVKNISQQLIAILINRIEIDENKEIDIYYNFKLD